MAEEWLTLLRGSVTASSARFLVVYVPFVEELDASTTLGRDAAQWRERTAFSRWLAEAEYLDLTRAFQEASSQGEHLYYIVNGHWTAAGHRLAAEEIAGHIRRSGLLPEAPRQSLLRDGS